MSAFHFFFVFSNIMDEITFVVDISFFLETFLDLINLIFLNWGDKFLIEDSLIFTSNLFLFLFLFLKPLIYFKLLFFGSLLHFFLFKEIKII